MTVLYRVAAKHELLNHFQKIFLPPHDLVWTWKNFDKWVEELRPRNFEKKFQRKKTAIPERDDRFSFAAPALFDICRQMCPSIADKSASRKGLVSIDRSEAAALLSTTPRLRTRSSTNDFAPLRCMGWVFLRPGLPAPGWLRAVLLWLCHRGRRKRSIPVYRCLPTLRR